MRQIIAMGGGGFSMEPDNLLLDQYILSQVKSSQPKVCFIPTASGDSQGYIDRFYQSFEHLPCVPTHLTLFKNQPRNLEEFILSKDILYVGGGNTRNMLVLWREWGLDQILRTALDNGVILAGLSAGAICWFEGGVTDSIPGELTGLKCLGLLAGSSCPHYDGESDRRSSYHRLLMDNKIGGGIALDDGVAAHYVDGRIHQIVSSRPQAKAYFVSMTNHQVSESIHTPVYLGAQS
ncbi:peptidase E [Paenibacillus sp. N1-5-1-14]|uniref:Type 1 glutamine amidotransferase-like domain-containing protein n=1 Tax=Paenibacillus radicibacter TaxID=2972488 RepID=UPI00215947E8|nr:peptidase E [Paenibacillus radicibacter]MCR8643546.1 peptidase E [Paenibacillus radicibacter]